MRDTGSTSLWVNTNASSIETSDNPVLTKRLVLDESVQERLFFIWMDTRLLGNQTAHIIAIVQYSSQRVDRQRRIRSVNPSIQKNSMEKELKNEQV